MASPMERQPSASDAAAPAPLVVEVVDEEGTAEVARALAAALGKGDTVILEGELGAGKTTFARAVARALGLPEDEPVTSPTFALVHEYQCGAASLLHADLYRLAHPDELRELGLEDAIGISAVALVEWGERFADALPGLALLVRLTATGADARTIALEPRGDRGGELVASLARDMAGALHAKVASPSRRA
jgi:tRNA threonylcarbamoyl adenosine modification protein YjeE